MIFSRETTATRYEAPTTATQWQGALTRDSVTKAEKSTNIDELLRPEDKPIDSITVTGSPVT